MQLTTIKLIQQAILNNRKLYQGIKLPKVQTGTFYQKQSYAFWKAQKLYEKHF